MLFVSLTMAMINASTLYMGELFLSVMSASLSDYFTTSCPILLLTVQWRWLLMSHNASLTVDSWEIVLSAPTLRLLLLICNATVFVYFKIV